MIPLERIIPDIGFSFKVIYHDVLPEVFQWNYHYHPEIELVFVFDGIGRRHVGNHVSFYEGGDLVLIGSNLPHSGFGYGALGMHEEIVLQFKKELIQDMVEFEKVNKMLRNAQFGVAFSSETKRALMPYFREIKNMQPFQRYLTLLSILEKLAQQTDFQLLNNAVFQQSNFSKDQDRVLRIFEFMEKNYAENIKTQALADLSHLTLPAFCTYFKKNFGVSFTDFLNEYRINQACCQLTEGKSVSDAAFQCGFNSISYFSRTFKQFKSISPSEFQNKVYEKKKAKLIFRLFLLLFV